MYRRVGTSGSTLSSSDCGVTSPVVSGGASDSSNRQRTIGELCSKLPCHMPNLLPPVRVPRVRQRALLQAVPPSSHVQRLACAVRAMRGACMPMQRSRGREMPCEPTCEPRHRSRS